MTSRNALIKTFSLTLAAAAAMSLAACGRNDDRTAGQKLDSAIATTEAATDKAAAEIKKEGAEAKAAIERSADKAEAAVDKSAAKVAESTDDARITASVNAELVKDPSLSALKIDVDTNNGKVMLQGKAPNQAARDRATTLASNVKGVTSVENRLSIGG